MASSLSINVFNSGYKPIPGGPGWDDSTPATWPASTSTLISGDHDAILVDALLTTSEGERLAAWARNTGKRLRAIFITHGHGDHFFGAGPVLDAFPGTQLIASDQQVVDEARGQTTPKAIASWNSRFARQFSESLFTSFSVFCRPGRPRRLARPLRHAVVLARGSRGV
jgi:glyoxylase-like metal-dependent hydrolase (beta-lactamase superfamily II)